ncbi:MAG: hypothetical protein BM556_05425 [Bacteriovorax sp. MedPE-SWde]|nr:MAG: hypothetical protein BM556_05425 [Bacteriovorax sp. MedPE-SWde]
MDIILKNTVSNYLCFIAKVVSGLILTSLLYNGLGKESYGFWVLLWSVYGYTLLLDFGFGFSIQKSSAEYVHKKDLTKLLRQINSIFFSYVFLAIGIVIFSLAFLYTCGSLFVAELGDPYYQNVYLFFAVVTAIIFPTGIFSEILVGLGHIYLRNIVRLVFISTNAVGILLMPEIKILELTVFSLLLHLIANLFLLYFVKKKISCFSLSIKYFDKSEVRELMRFSLSAYVVIFTNLILFNSDQIILSSIAGVGSVGIYHLATRLPFFMKMLNEQFQENVFPLLVSKRNIKFDMILTGNKFISFISNLSFSFAFVFAEEIIYIWIGETNPEIILIAHLSLCYSFIATLFKSINNSYLMANDQVSKVVRFSLLEVILNLALTFLLVPLIGVVGAVVASLLALFISLLFYVPYFVKQIDVHFSTWYKKIFKKNNLVLLINLSALSIVKLVLNNDYGLLYIATLALVSGLLYLYMFFNFVWDEYKFNNKYLYFVKRYSLDWKGR